MALADEIAVKLGLSTAQFKQALRDAGADIKKFKEGAEDKKGVAAFFDFFEHKLTSMKHLGAAVSTALGLNFEAIAEKLARWKTGISKEEEEAYKQLGEVSSQVADANIAAMRAGLSEEKKYQLALMERAGILKRISDESGKTGVSQLKIAQEQMRLSENSRIIEEHKLAVLKEQTTALKEQTALNEKTIEDGRVGLDIYQKRRVLEGDLRALRKFDALQSGNELQHEIDLQMIKSRENQLEQINAEIKKRGVMEEKEQYEFTVLQYKAKTGLTDAEKKRYETLKISTKELKLQSEIDDLISKSHSEKLTPAENQRLVALQNQVKVLERQKGIINQMPADVAKVTEQVVSLTDAWKDFTVSLKIKEGKSDFDLTDRELDEKIQNLKNQNFMNLLDDQKNPGDWTGHNYNPASYFTQQSLAAATAAQTERDQFRLRYATQGEQAFAGYSAFDEQRLRGYIQTADDSKKTAQSVSSIERTLQQVFPDQYRKGG